MSQAPATGTIGSPFIELQSIDSTNNYARQQIHAGLAQHGMVIFTHEQVAGRGQRGKVWTSEKDMNITLSILLNPKPLQLRQQYQLNICIAVAVHDFFSRYAIDKASIKWPNDLYWQDRKAGGILIESIVGATASDKTVEGKWDWAITGIGININQTSFPAYLPNPVSLKQITGSDYKPVPLTRELCHIIQHYFDKLVAGGYESIHHQYNRHLYKLNEKVRLKKNTRIFEAVIKEVNHRGKLMVQHAIEEELEFGEVEWVI